MIIFLLCLILLAIICPDFVGFLIISLVSLAFGLACLGTVLFLGYLLIQAI